MFKGKFKNYILILLVVITGFFLVACKENKVDVSSIQFVEDNDKIILTMGEEYTPEILITPSYATNRSYSLFSMDTTVLKIKNEKILGVGEGTTYLKVVSSDTNTLNDVILVKVLAETKTLSAPTGLSFDGEMFSFNPVEDAYKYTLSINGEEIDIGNNTKYALSSFENSQKGNVYNNVLEVKVKAEGNMSAVLSSQYSNSIKVAKLGNVQNINITNGVLSFSGINNVVNYGCKIFKNSGEEVSSFIISSGENVVSYNISSYVATLAQGQYFVKVIPLSMGYGEQNVNVFAPTYEFATSKELVVLGSPTNLKMNNYVLSWDKVQFAKYYNIYNNGVLFKSNVSESCIDLLSVKSNFLPGNYNFSVEAIAEDNDNIVNLRTVSNDCAFNVLSYVEPKVSYENKTVFWDNVDNATGYLYEIYLQDRLVKSGFVIDTSIDISFVGANTYTVKVTAYGDGANYLNNCIPSSVNVSKLNAVSNLKVENKVVSWEDKDTNSKQTYNLSISYGQDLIVETNTTEKSYDLTTLINGKLAIGEYTVKVQSVGANNVFDSSFASCVFIQIADVDGIDINSGVISFNKVSNASKYKMEIINTTTEMEEFSTELSAGGSSKVSFKLSDYYNVSSGKYNVKLYAYGDGKSVLDAYNVFSVDTTNFIYITKLSVSTLSLADGNRAITRDNVGAVSYDLYTSVNGGANTISQMSTGVLDISNLMEGEYEYKVLAKGNGKEILDAEMSNSIKVLKLSAPKISFDKTTNIVSLSSKNAGIVDNYDVYLGEEKLTHIKDDFSKFDITDKLDVNIYDYEIRAVATGTSSLFDVVIASFETNYQIKRINPTSYVKVDGEYINIIPTGIDDISYNYTPTIKALIGEDYYAFNKNEIVFDSSFNGYKIRVYDENYNLIEYITNQGQNLFEQNSEIKFSVYYKNESSALLDSGEIACINSVLKLEKSKSIEKDSQTIKFELVNDANCYLLFISNKTITLNDEDYTVDNGYGIVEFDTLAKLLNNAGIKLLTSQEYTVQIIAKYIPSSNNENMYISSKSDCKLTFTKLDKPNVDISISGENKILTITAMGQNSFGAKLVFTDQANNQIVILREYVNNKIAIDIASESELSSLESGAVEIVVYSYGNGDYFISDEVEYTYSRIETPTFEIVSGKLKLTNLENVSKYKLNYSSLGSTEYKTIDIKPADCEKIGNDLYYDFASLSEGSYSAYLVAIGEGKYINSKNGEEKSFKKLPNVEIKEVGGEIQISVLTSIFNSVSNALINGVALDFETLKDNDDIIFDLGAPYTTITMPAGNYVDFKTTESTTTYVLVADHNGKKALSEITSAEYNLLSAEDKAFYTNKIINSGDINIKLMSKDGTNYLNSNTTLFTAKGLPSVQDLKITKTTNSDLTETSDTITWNHIYYGIVSKYKVLIAYKGHTYSCETVNRYLAFPKGYDADGDGSFDGKNDVVFADGSYSISVRAMIDSNVNSLSTIKYLNSTYCDPIQIDVMNTVDNITSTNGILTWDRNDSATQYVIRLYEGNDDTEPKYTVVADTNRIDLASKLGCEAKAYNITVQPVNINNPFVINGVESNKTTVLILPKVDTLWVENGALYLKVLNLFKNAYITLISADGTEYALTYANSKLDKNTSGFDFTIDNINNYLLQENNFKDYILINDIKNYIPYRYEGNNGVYINCLDKIYSIKVQLDGYADGNIIVLSSVESLNDMIYDKDDSSIKYQLEKLKTPYIDINTPGIIEWGIKDVVYNDLIYDGITELQVYLISINSKYNFYAVKKSQVENLAGYNAEEKVYINNGINYNVFDDLSLDFNKQSFVYYTTTNSKQTIDFANGGTFDVSIRLLGDDTRYLTSNAKTVKITRYETLSLSLYNGKLIFKDLNSAPYYEKTNPIYILTLRNTVNNNVQYVCLYNKGSHISESVVKEYLNSNDVIFVEKDYSKALELEGYDYKLIDYDFEGIASGIYSITTQVYNTLDSKTLLPSKISGSCLYEILKTPEVELSSGRLSWKQISVVDIDSTIKITDYEIHIYNDEFDKTILISSGDYPLVNNSNMIYYNFLDNLGLIEGETYNIQIKAIGNEKFISSSWSIVGTYRIALNVENAEFEDRRISWTNRENASVEVIITFEDNGNTITISDVSYTDYYILPYYITYGGTTRYLSSDYIYDIKLRVLGNNVDTLSSFPLDTGITAYRLKEVDKASFTSNEGVLTWDEVELQKPSVNPVVYEITTTDSQGNKYVITTTNNYFDFKNNDVYQFASGEINVSIKAMNYDFFDSSSVSVKVIKLGIVKNVSYAGSTTNISWNNIDNAEKYLIEVYEKEGEDYSLIKTEEILIGEGTTSYDLTGIISEMFFVKIKALRTSSVKDNLYINGEFSSYIELSKPSKVDDGLTINQENYQIEWSAIDGELPTDKYYLGYKFSQNGTQFLSVEEIEITDYSMQENKKKYYYILNDIGYYKDIYVYVNRDGSVSSDKVYIYNDNTAFEYLLFASGRGDNSSPYTISTLEQLKNIKFRLSSTYLLLNDIDFVNSNSRVLTEEFIFSGTLNGNGKALRNLSIYTNQNYNAIFARTNNATFNDLQINNVNIGSNSANQLAVYKYYAGVLTAEAIGSTFNNVAIYNSSVKANYQNSGESNGRIYLGAIAGYAENCKISGGRIELVKDDESDGLAVAMQGYINTYVYFGALFGYAKACDIDTTDMESIWIKYSYTLKNMPGNTSDLSNNVKYNKIVGAYNLVDGKVDSVLVVDNITEIFKDTW